MSINMNNMYSMMLTSMIQKMKTQLDEMETMARFMDKMNKENVCYTSSTCNNDNEIDLSILMHRFAILERRLAAVEESKNIFVSQNEDDAWLVGSEDRPVENEVIELSSLEEDSTPVVVKKANEAAEAKKKAEEEVAAAVAAAKKKAEEEAAAKKKAEEEAAAKKKAEEEAAAKREAEEKAAAEAKIRVEEEAKKKAKEESLAKKKAEEEAARKKEEERKKAEEAEEEEEEEEATELTEFEYKGQTYYRDEDNLVYVLVDGELSDPVGRFSEKTSGVKMFAK